MNTSKAHADSDSENRQEQKTFAISGRAIYTPIIRQALLDRGWVEKFADPIKGSSGMIAKLEEAPDRVSLITSQLMGQAKIKCLWFATYTKMIWNPISTWTIVNRFPSYKEEPMFTSKVGLLRALERQHWTNGGAKEYWVRYPRTFHVSSREELRVFSEHYRVSACLALIRIFLDRPGVIDPVVGSVSLDIVDFALKRLCEFVAYKENADLDVWNITNVTSAEWDKFLNYYKDIAHFRCLFKPTAGFSVKALQKGCRTVLIGVARYWPDLVLEGHRNIWIVKPGFSSRGRGVTVHKSLDSIQSKCKRSRHYVIQKYIEKPYLIHDTKFDIRQWILITSVEPLIIWMYEEFYLRFCSRKFSLDDTHESVHLSNNCVQRKYQADLVKTECRHPELPSNNMWTCHQFLKFLGEKDEAGGWTGLVAGMKGALIGAALAAQECLRHRQNSFFLLGADFMLSSDLRPWLLEINSSPAMGPTTSVTKAMCQEALTDVLKVVIDRARNNDADTGKFRLIYRQRYAPDVRPLTDLCLQAKKIRLGNDENISNRKKSKNRIHEEFQSSDKSLDRSESTIQFGSGEEVINSWDLRSIKYEELVTTYKRINIDSMAAMYEKQNNLKPRLPGSAIDDTLFADAERNTDDDDDSVESQSLLGDILMRLDDRNSQLLEETKCIDRVLEMTTEALSTCSKSTKDINLKS